MVKSAPASSRKNVTGKHKKNIKMNKLDELKKAIQEKRIISFEYNKQGKTPGKRIGNPYAIFIFTSKSGTQSTKVHIEQTDGVSDSKATNPLPDFRMFNITEFVYPLSVITL